MCPIFSAVNIVVVDALIIQIFTVILSCLRLLVPLHTHTLTSHPRTLITGVGAFVLPRLIMDVPHPIFFLLSFATLIRHFHLLVCLFYLNSSWINQSSKRVFCIDKSRLPYL